MMNGKGILVICGNSVAELEQELKMLKMAISTGAVMGCGGSTIGGVEQALKALTSAMGGVPSTADECNCISCGGNCECRCVCCGEQTDEYGNHCNGYDCYSEDEYDDEEVEYCPNCDDILDENGYCENCGYYWEDAEEDDDDELSPSAILAKLLESLEDRGEMNPTIGCLLDLLDGMM